MSCPCKTCRKKELDLVRSTVSTTTEGTIKQIKKELAEVLRDYRYSFREAKTDSEYWTLLLGLTEDLEHLTEQFGKWTGEGL